MTQRLWIPGPLPGMNEIIAAAKSGGKGRVYAAMKASHTSAVTLFARKARLKPIDFAVFGFDWHEPTRRRDPDNLMAGAKFILDGLVKAGVIPNDGWDNVGGLVHCWTLSKNRGVHVTIEEKRPLD